MDLGLATLLMMSAVAVIVRLEPRRVPVRGHQP